MNNQLLNIKETINSLYQNFESTFAQGNAKSISEFYTERAMLVPPESDLVQGKENIAAFWQTAIDMGIKSVKLNLLEIEQHGDTAIEVGKYTMMTENNDVIDHGKGIVIWKLENGHWKLHRDMWNTSLTQH